MSFDIGDVLTQAWQITWRNKSLWWFGIIIALAISPIFLFMLLPFSIPFLTESQAVNSNPSIILLTMMGFVLLSIIFFVVLYISSTLINTAVILGIWRAAEGKERVALIELLKNSLPFFWRVLGIMFLYTAALMIVNIGIQVFTLLISLVTLGLGALCAMPLMFLLYPVMFIGSVWLELAINSIVIDKMTIMEAARNGWRMIRNNVLAIILVTVVIYFGIKYFFKHYDRTCDGPILHGSFRSFGWQLPLDHSCRCSIIWSSIRSRFCIDHWCGFNLCPFRLGNGIPASNPFSEAQR